MGSGKAISAAGPGVLLVYAVIGGVLFFVMRALGEVLLSDLDYKSFADVAHDLIGPWAEFFVECPTCHRTFDDGINYMNPQLIKPFTAPAIISVQ